MAKYLKDLKPAPVEKTAAGKTATVFDNQVKVDKLAARTAVREAKKAGENPFATAVKEQKADKSGSFNLGTAAKAAAGGIVTGMASIAGTGAMVEDVVGGALDKVFQGAGFKGSGIFNTLYNGDTALAKALGLKGIKSEAEYYRNMAAENAKKISTGNDTIDNILKKAAMAGQDVAYGVGAAAPMAATAMFSAPAEAAAGLAEVGKNGLIRKGAEVVERSGVLKTLGDQARKLLTSRDYWTAFAQEVGQDYYEALGDGATEDQALTYAVLTSLGNAGIEVGGGIQNTTQPIWKSAIEEGREEVEQGPIQRLMQNAVYGKGNPFLSVKNENAVINPVTALKEFGMGAAVGGILGAGQRAIGAAANRVADSLAAESQATVGEVTENREENGRNKINEGAAQQFPDAQKPRGNGLTAAVDATPMNSVPQSTEKVNQEGMSFSAADRQDQGQQATGRGFDKLARETASAGDAYMDALAQDENAPGQQRYTVGDAVRDFRARLLTQQEAPVEVEREAPPSAEDMADLVDLFADVANPIGTREDRIRDTENMVTDHTVVQKASAKQRAENAWSYFVRKMVDAGHSVTKVGQAVNDPYLYALYNAARASASAGTNMINGEQTDVLGRNVGKSLNDIFGPIRAKGEDYYQAFQLYLFDLHNVDRMSLSQNKEELVTEAQKALAAFDEDNPDIRTTTEAQLMRLAESTDEQVAELARERIRLIRELNKVEAIRDKPVFGYEVTAEDSRERARRALEQHPEFAEYQQQVRKYIDNLMQYRVDSGLMSAEDAIFLQRFYPNYVPTMRVGSKSTGAGRNLNTVRVGKTVGRAVGGNERLVPLHEALGRQTMKVVREGSKNRFAAQMLTDYLDHGDGTNVNRYIQDATEYESDFSLDSIDNTDEEPLKKDKTVTAYLDGKMWEMTVDDSLFEAMKALSPDAQEVNTATAIIRKANNLFKGLVTGYNPLFLVRNTVRDLQTAGLYTRDMKSFAENYPNAIREIAQDGEYWRLYKAMGGVYSSVFDYATGTVSEPTTKAGKFIAKVEALNMATEQAPRLAEFMSVIKKAEANGKVTQKVLADALHAAADVTVNFGRSGTLGKLLNANFVPFLNPGIQGFDKMVRRVTETRGAKEWAKLAVRATLLGIAPSLLNRLLYRDDNEWKRLRDSDKDTNYMFKLGNGIWLKIPKGRELSVLGITASRITDLAQGSKVDWQDYIATVGNQVAPANPLKSNIASAIVDSRLFDASDPGHTWYGGSIESQRLQSYAPGQRYDSSTDVISKAVGGALNVSPAKLNYILDQYSGVVGDIVLPLLTPQAERNPFSKAFTVDVKTNNRVGNDFYAERDELTYAKNGGDQAAAVVSRFWARQASSCSEIWKEIREIETSKLSDKEKRRQTRELKEAVTTIQRNALEVEETYRKAAERYVAAGLDTDEAYREANRECFGAEYALEAYNKDVYARAQNAYENGVGYDAFYDYYFATKGMKATDGVSKATQQFQYLQSSGLNLTAQAEIYYADIAADSTLAKQAELETSSGITAEEYYQYKAASSGMTRKEEKLAAIDGLDISDGKKDAIYLSEGYAESKIGEAPWRGGVLASPGVTEATSGNPFLAAIQRQRQQQGSGSTPRVGVSFGGGNPFLRAAAPSGGNPFLRAAAVSGGNPFLRAAAVSGGNPFLRRP